MEDLQQRYELELALMRQQLEAQRQDFENRLQQLTLSVSSAAAGPSTPSLKKEWLPPRPSVFDGTKRDHSATSWLYTVQEYLKAVNMPLDRAVCFVKGLLSHHAITWIRTIETQQNQEFTTWEEFCHAFTEQYVSPLLSENARRDLRTTQQRGAAVSYTHLTLPTKA